MFAKLLLGLMLVMTPADPPATAATAVTRFMEQLDSVAVQPHQARAEAIRDRYRELLVPLDPQDLADRDMDALLVASMTAAGLANDRAIAKHALAIFDEMAKRSLLIERRYGDMQQLYVNLRDFEAARAFHAAFGDEHVLNPVPDVLPAAGFDPARRSVLVPVGMGALQARNFDATQDDFVLVVADPLCHFTQDAANAIGLDPDLHAYFANHSRWVAPYGVRLETRLVDAWNARFPAFPMVLVDDIRTWPDIDYWGTPTFYVFVQGQVVETIRGWPGEGRADELKRALGIRRTDP